MAGAPTLVGEALELELTGDPGSIALARAAARDFASACGADPDDLALAVSEAVTNAIVHGYRGGNDGVVGLTGYREDDDCVVEVTDSGVGMRPNPRSPGLGLGLPVISSVAASVEIVSLGNGTAIRMRFPRVC
jgi:anti-sigma regulatory factor (Ser/Thr protein kinase)